METESVAVPWQSNIQQIGNKDQTHCRNKGESKRTGNKAETKGKANGYETKQKQRRMQMDRDFKAETKGKANGYETRKSPSFYTYEIFRLPDGDPNAKESYSGSPQSSCGDDGSREQAVERLSKRKLQ